MKRFIAVLSSLLVLPAFAEVAPVFYDEVIEYTDEEIVDANDETAEVQEQETEEKNVSTPVVVQSPKVNPRGVNGRTVTASRVVPAVSNANTRSAGARVVASSRTATNNGATVRSRTATNARTTTVTARTSNVAARPTRATTATTKNTGVTSRRANTSNSGARTARYATAVTQTDTVNAPIYSGRVATRTGARASAMRARIPTATAVSSTTTVAEEPTSSMVEAVVSMDEIAQMTDYCKAQYTSCMDNFCDVLDDNQGRCSCSKNVKNYEKTEIALKDATNALQDVAQQIQYLGLSTDQINSLFTETEAEAAMSAGGDNTQLKNDLDRIKSMIVDVKTGTASSSVTVDSGINFDLSGLLNFNVEGSGFDLGSLFGPSKSTANTASISNQRGEQLYKTAAARCKAAILTDCQNQGVDISIITNSYDMEIDKSCVAYERNLKDSNEQMAQTVRNATGVLQRARLMLAQQKNAYDLRECVNALDSCMQNDFVCGSDYENCLDPTGKYIVNGEVVIGSQPGAPMTANSTDTGTGIYATWNYKVDNADRNAWTKEGSLAAYITAKLGSGDNNSPITETTLSDTAQAQSSMATYLMSKIGYQTEEGINYGMCMSVLNQCQDYTYEDKQYKFDNQVVREYLQRTLVQIKAAQDNLLSEYAEDCITDVTSCLTNNGFSTSTLDNATKLTTKNQIAINACNSQILTCMSANDVEETEGELAASQLPKTQWVLGIMNETGAETALLRINCTNSGGNWTTTDNTSTCKCPEDHEIDEVGFCKKKNESGNINVAQCTEAELSSLFASNGTKSSGTCVPTECITGYELENSTCIETQKKNNCTASGGNWKAGSCHCNTETAYYEETGFCVVNQSAWDELCNIAQNQNRCETTEQSATDKQVMACDATGKKPAQNASWCKWNTTTSKCEYNTDACK